MRKMWKIYALAAGLMLSLASALLVLSPVPVLAADGTANCGGFTRVRCAASAVRCVCQDGVGCTSYFADGTTSEATCKDANGGPAMEEDPVN
jgi:hypothetical protein